ncbi:RICIN domain-containing protein [Terasakiella sp.]|uniref:RICIN domain-containing protein n=1 Tax=Terasakiella sp. TaxID=2034861 RepID=UPI003AA997FD
MLKLARVLLFLSASMIGGEAPAFAESLEDHIPGVAKFKALEKVVVQHVQRQSDRVVVTGTLNGKGMRFTQLTAKNVLAFYVEPEIGTLIASDLIPPLRDLPGVNEFGIDRVTFQERTLQAEADIEIDHVPFGVLFDFPKENVVLRSDAPDSRARLGAAIPVLRDIPLVKDLIVKQLSLQARNRVIEVAGKLNEAEMSLSLDVSKGLRAAVVSLRTNTTPIALGTVMTNMRNVPLVNNFAFEKLSYGLDTKTFDLTGKIVDAEVTLTVNLKKGIEDAQLSLKATRAPLSLANVIVELKDAPIVNDLTFEALTYDVRTKMLAGTGMLNKAEAEVTLDLSKGGKAAIIDLKATHNPLTLGQVLTDLNDVPLVNVLGLVDISYNHQTKTIMGEARLHRASGVLSLDVKNGLQNLIVDLKAKNEIVLSDVLDNLEGLPIINDYAFKDLSYRRADKNVMLTGELGNVRAVLSLTTGPAREMVVHADKPVGLADVLDPLKGFPGIGLFGIQSIGVKDNTVSADLAFAKETATLAVSAKPSGGAKALKSMVLNVTPDTSHISVAQLFPELSGVPGFKGVSLSGLKFVEKSKELMASIDFASGAKATLSTNKDTSQKSSTGNGSGGIRVFKLKSPDLSLGDVIPSLSHIALLNTLKFDELDITKSTIDATVELGGETVKIFAGIGKGFAALDFGALDLASLIPGAGEGVLKGVKMARSVFVLANNAGVTHDDLPDDMKFDAGDGNSNTAFKKGVNFLAAIRKADLGEKLSSLLNKLSISAPSLPVAGMFPTEIFDFIKGGAGDVKKEIVTVILDSLDIAINVPAPAIKGMDKILTFEDAHLSISGNQGNDVFWGNLPSTMQAKKPTGRLDVSLRSGVKLHLNAFGSKTSKPIALTSLIDMNVDDGKGSVSMLGLVDGEWEHPFGIKGLTFEKSGFDIALSGGEGGAEVDLSFFSDAKLHDKDDVVVDASFVERGGLPHLEHFIVQGPIALSDVAGHLPNGGNFILNALKIYPDGIEAKVEAKNKLFDETTNLYLFEIDTPSGKNIVAAIDLAFNAKANSKQNFSLGRLAKIAGLSGDKVGVIQTNLNAMAVANAALILSNKKIYPLAVDNLKSGVAKDLFTDIFGTSQVPVKLDNVTFLSDFKADLMGDIGDKLVNGVKGVKLGLSEQAIINGAIGGLFDSDPLNLDLEFLLAQSLSLDDLQKTGLKLPSFLKAKPKRAGSAEKVGLFLKVVDTTFEVGLLAGFDVAYNDTTFDFTGTLGIQLAEEEIGLSLTGAMSDTWQNALGIKGFELENVTVSGEVEVEPPSIKLGLAGDADFWGHNMLTAGDIIIGLAGEVPIPEGLGVKTKISTLDVEMYEIIDTVALASYVPNIVVSPYLWPAILVGVVADVALSEGYTVIYDEVKGKKVTGKQLAEAPFAESARLMKDFAKLQGWIFGGKDIYMSFATPGASDANLGIPDGIHFSGKIELLGGLIKSPSIQPDIGWIYKIVEAVHTAESDVKKTVSGAGKAVAHGASDAGHETKALSETEFKEMKRKLNLLRDILTHELGLAKKKIEIDYPKPTKKQVQDFLAKMSFTQTTPFKLGGLEFRNNHISMMPFKITSTTSLFGNEEDVEMFFKDGKLVLQAKTKLEVIGETDLLLEFDLKKKDFIIAGEYSNNLDLKDWLVKEVQNGIKQIASTADSKYKTLESDLSKVQDLNKKAQKDLELAQKVADAVSKDAVNRLRNTTQGYRRDYEYANNKYNGCHGWKKYYCKSKWWPRKGLAWDTWKASDELLKDAEKALSEAKALAIAVHKAEIKATDAATKVALAAKDVAAATDIKSIITKGLSSFANDAERMANVFKVDKAFIGGSVQDVVKGKPLVMELYFELDGKKYREYLAFSPADPEFNSLSFGLMPIIAAEHIVHDLEEKLEQELSSLKSLGNLADKLTTWLQAHIYELVGGLRDGLEQRIANIEYELSQEESKLQKVFASLDGHGGKFLKGYQDLTDQTNAILSTYKMTDFMPHSEQFTNRYLAVGHSALCLGVAANGVDVYQENCKDVEAERWTAEPVKDFQGGYIMLKSKGLCLQARDPKANSGQPLVLAECNGKDDHEKWKFISQDEVYSKFVNRFSQKCLHFDTVNANEKAGYAIWTSCFGADSQGFRIIEDAEKPTYHEVNQKIKAQNGYCLQVDKDFESYFNKTRSGHSTSNHQHLINMQRQMDNQLLVGSCSANDNSSFNYVETVDGNLKLVHAQSGWCVVPGIQGEGLILMPCDNGDDMFWQIHAMSESTFTLRNKSKTRCIDLEMKDAGRREHKASLASCQKRPEQDLEFLKP